MQHALHCLGKPTFSLIDQLIPVAIECVIYVYGKPVDVSTTQYNMDISISENVDIIFAFYCIQ